MIQLVDGQQRDTQLARLRLGSLGGRDRLNLQAVLYHLAYCIYHVVRSGTGAQTNNHAVLYILCRLIAGKLLHIHCIRPPLT